MITTHVIFGDFDKDKIDVLKKYKINIESLGFNRFDLVEGKLYHSVKPFIEQWGFSDTPITKFSKEECDEAQYLVVQPAWQPLYPMPDNNGGYLSLTYDTSNYCEGFGTGLIQKSPFRIKQEPKWSNNKIFGLYWINDELFVHIDTYESIFKPLGIQSIPVLLHKKDIEIKSTIQLILPESDAQLDLEKYPFSTNSKYKKYENINSGFFPSFLGSLPKLSIFKSQEYFGTGAAAFKIIFMSGELRKLLIKEKIKLTY